MMKPARYIAEARAEGVSVTEELKNSLKWQLTRLRNKSDGLLRGNVNNWDGIASVLEYYKKEKLSISQNIPCTYLA